MRIKRTFDGKLIYARLRINNYRKIAKSVRGQSDAGELKMEVKDIFRQSSTAIHQVGQHCKPRWR